ARRALGWRELYEALLESARTTSMLFLILIGALMFAEFVNITTMPADLKAFVSRFEVHPLMVVAAIMVIYVVLGTAMEELSMILLTVPLFFPLIVHMGLDPVWFGILILIGALMFAEFVNITTMPADLKAFVSRFEVHPLMVVAAIMVIYVVLGTAMEELSMILLTVPLFFPLIVHMGLDPVWFGILIVVVVEIGLISPPVGMNLFVLNTLLPQVPTRTIFRGVMPFVLVDCVRLAILVAFPIISTFLPSMMK